MAIINNIQAELLEALGRYGFLAVTHCRVLTGKSVGYLREMLGSLKSRKFINSYCVKVTHKIRAENIYYLTEKGKEFLLVHAKVFADDIKLPIGTPLAVRDYFHRHHFISCQIALYQHLGSLKIPVECFYTYFDKTGSARKSSLTAKSKIPLRGKAFYIPDGILKTSRKLYLIEMYADKDSKRILKSLGTHAEAIALGTPGKTFGIEVNPYVLAVFEYTGIKEAVIKRLRDMEGFKSLQDLYYFASLEEVKNDPADAWKTINNETIKFL